MDLRAFYAACQEDGWGGAAHHPKTMVALLIYAYCLGVRSSRQIERACQVDVAFRAICAGLFPADELVEVLEGLVAERTAPEFLRMDNGPEMIAWALKEWCRLGSTNAGSRSKYPHVSNSL